MSGDPRVHRYRVVEVYDESFSPGVKAGMVLRDRWRGKSHTYIYERAGKLSKWCRVEWIEKVTS